MMMTARGSGPTRLIATNPPATHNFFMRPTQLNPDTIDGAFLGHYRNDPTTPTPAVVPTTALNKHLLITGQTGSGKSTTAAQAIRTTHRHTDGPTIVIDPKDGDWLATIARAVYADARRLDDTDPAAVFEPTLAFASDHGVPQLPLFDLRPALAAGVDRTDAIESVVGEMDQLIKQLQDAPETAQQAPDLLKSVVRMLFDPATGADTYPLSEIYRTLTDITSADELPAVATPPLTDLRDRFVAMPDDQFSAVANAATARLEKLVADPYIRAMFDAVPESRADGFQLSEYLSEDVLLLVDLSAYPPAAAGVIAHVLLWQLWQPLSQWPATTTRPTTLWVDEAPQLGVHDQLATMCELGRAYELTVATLLQSPRQLQAASNAAYESILTNVHNVVAGHLDSVDLLAEKLADDQYTPAAIRELLRTCPADQWLFSPAAADRGATAATYIINEPPVPPGDPQGTAAFASATAQTFTRQWDAVKRETHTAAGVTPGATPAAADGDSATDATPELSDATIRQGLSHTLITDPDLPSGVTYDSMTNTLRCTTCDTEYLPRGPRMATAAACCTERDPAEIPRPPTTVALEGVSPPAVRAHPCSLYQLMLLRLVERVEHHAIDPPAYDIVSESMLRLREAAGLTKDAVDTLVELGYLDRQTDFQDRLYRLTPAGKAELRELRDGTAPEPHPGDPNESAAHIRLVVGAARELQTVADSDDTPIETVVRYWDVPESDRTIDVAGLDASGDVVVAIEAERATGDRATAAPADYDTMAGVDPAAALWVVPNRATGHTILRALVNPAEGAPRVQRSESDLPARTTPLHRLTLTATGCTDLSPLSQFDTERITQHL